MTAFKADVELLAGSDGIYDVVVDDVLIFSKKKERRFPEDGEVAKLIEAL